MKYYIEAENEAGSESLAELIEAATWEDAAEELRRLASLRWPGAAWRPMIVAEAIGSRDDLAKFLQVKFRFSAENVRKLGDLTRAKHWVEAATTIGVLAEIFTNKPHVLDERTCRAVRAIFAALDVKLAGELRMDVMHAGSVLATLMMMRDTVYALDPALGELDFPQAHAAAQKGGAK